MHSKKKRCLEIEKEKKAKNVNLGVSNICSKMFLLQNTKIFPFKLLYCSLEPLISNCDHFLERLF